MWYQKNNFSLLSSALPPQSQAMGGLLSSCQAIAGVLAGVDGAITLPQFIKLVEAVREASNYAPSFIANIPLSCYEALFGAEAVAERRFFNVGAGNFWGHPAWTMLDISPADGPQGLRIDFEQRSPWPIAAGVGKLAYSSHCLEHLHDDSVAHVLKEVFRILEAGSRFRLVLPDADLFLAAYRMNNRAMFFNVADHAPQADTSSIEQLLVSMVAYPCSSLSVATADLHIPDESVRRIAAGPDTAGIMTALTAHLPKDVVFPDHPHVNWFNFDKLQRMLAVAGFVDIARSAFGQSAVPVLLDTNFFDSTTPETSVFVECRKPA